MEGLPEEKGEKKLRRLEGKVALVTGAMQGIGAGASRVLPSPASVYLPSLKYSLAAQSSAR